MPAPFPVELAPPSPAWHRVARCEAARLAAALGTTVRRVHHIGSTAIPGIRAKPIIDLIPEAESLAALDAAEPIVRGLGYAWWGDYGIAGRRYCTLSDPVTGARQVQLHGFAAASPEIPRHLAFRDFLIRHPDKAHAYEAEKLRCRDLHPDDTHAYTDAKGAWIRAAEAEAVAFFADGTHDRARGAPLFALRPADRQDFDFAWSLYRDLMADLTQALVGSWNEGGQRSVVRDALAVSGTSIVVIGGVDSGWFQVAETPEDIALAQVYVSPAWQNQGIGGAIVRGLSVRAQQRGKRLTLDVMTNNRARGLYERLGFRVTATSPYKLTMTCDHNSAS